jgi:hypothetical protein
MHIDIIAKQSALCIHYVIGEIIFITSSYFHYTHRRRVSASTASQQHVDHRHSSRRVTSDNPHGFFDKTLARLRAIEDPAEREKAEKEVLAMRRRSEKSRLKAEYVVRKRDHENERKRQQKLNAGYVLLIVCC